MQAHISSGVVIDVAAFKVGHSVHVDKDATGLRAARAGSSSVGTLVERSRVLASQTFCDISSIARVRGWGWGWGWRWG